MDASRAIVKRQVGMDGANAVSIRVIPFTTVSKYVRLKWCIVSLGLLYPLLVYLGSRYCSPRILALVLVLLVLGRQQSILEARFGPWAAAAGLLLAVLAFGSNSARLLKMYPVLVSGSLLTVFASSLWYPPPIIERIARLRTPDLSQPAVLYTRRVTQAWCVFFSSNGLLAFWTALRWSDQAWFIYNGIIAYVLLAAFFAGEWLVRRRVLKGSSAYS